LNLLKKIERFLLDNEPQLLYQKLIKDDITRGKRAL